MTTARNPEYTDVVQTISQMLFQTPWEGEPNLDKKVRELDSSGIKTPEKGRVQSKTS